MKLYFPIKNPEKVNGCTHIKAEVFYDLGGTNYFTYKVEPRGYYMSIIPVEKVDRGGYVTESYTAFTGKKMLIKEVKRKSAKAENEANGFFKENIEQYVHALFPHVEVEIN